MRYDTEDPVQLLHWPYVRYALVPSDAISTFEPGFAFLIGVGACDLSDVFLSTAISHR